MSEINKRLSLKEVNHDPLHKIKLLALDGEIIPGQCAISWEKPDKHSVTKVSVIFEVIHKGEDDEKSSK